MLRARMAILEKCGFSAHAPGKAEGFAIISHQKKKAQKFSTRKQGLSCFRVD